MCGSGCRSVSLSGMEALSEVSLSWRTATPRRAGLSRRERAVRASQVLEALLQDGGADRLSLVLALERAWIGEIVRRRHRSLFLLPVFLAFRMVVPSACKLFMGKEFGVAEDSDTSE